MIGGGEAAARAVAGAVKSAVGQVRLDAGVNITGLLVDIDMADDVDFRQHFMCWHLTRVLGPSLTEMVPPAVVRGVTGRETVQMHWETPDWSQLDVDSSAMGQVCSGVRLPWSITVSCIVSAGLPLSMGPAAATGNEQSRAEYGCLRIDDRHRSDRVLFGGTGSIGEVLASSETVGRAT